MVRNFLLALFAVLISVTLVYPQGTGQLSGTAELTPTPLKTFVPETRAQWDLELSFDLNTATGAAGNAGAEFDGTYLYTTRWATNLIHKYDMAGNLIEEFSIPGVSGLRDLAFDGTYFYGGAAANTIYQMDFVTKTLIGTISSPVAVRFIAYDEASDAFWCGTWTDNPTLVSRSGANLGSFTTGLSGQYGAAYDPTGPYLWIFDQGGGICPGSMMIIQYDIASGTATGVAHDACDDLTDGIAGGLFTTSDYISGKFSIGGVEQSNSGLDDTFFIYELYDVCGYPPASNPNPANGATDVSVNLATLSWTNPAGMINNDLYFNGNLVQSGTGSSWNISPTPLNYFTNYTWQVVAHFDTCDKSANFSFQTEQNPNLCFVTENFYPQSVDYWTGTTDGTNKTDVSEVRGQNTEDGWFMFDISSVPADAVVDSMRFYGYVNYTYYPFWSLTPLPGLNPLTATASELKTAITNNSGTTLAYVYANETSTFTTGPHNYLMGGTAGADFEAAIANGWFAAGMDSRDNSATYYINWDGWNQTNAPYITVSYHYECGNPTNVIFQDNFDSYTAGQQLACQATPDWTTWSILPCDAIEDAYVSNNYAYSGTNSFVVVQNNDEVHPMPNYTTGNYEIRFYNYIPTGKTGYFNTLALFDASNSQWGLEVYFNAGGAGALNAGGNNAATFTYSFDTWVLNQVMVDLDNDLAQYWYNGTMIYQWQWTLGASGTAISLQLGGNDFFGAAATDEMYVDDYVMGYYPVPVELTSFTANANNGNVVLNWQTASETNNQGFEVQRNSGQGFNTVGFVQGNGTSTQIHNYSFVDRSLAPGSYTYRLKQVDFNGTTEFSSEVSVSVEVPKVYSLEQNFPNPFNPATQINFSLAADSKVTLKIFNILGQEVKTLLNGNMPAGGHSISFNASNLPSGVYIYRIEANGANGRNFTAVKKMVLTK